MPSQLWVFVNRQDGSRVCFNGEVKAARAFLENLKASVLGDWCLQGEEGESEGGATSVAVEAAKPATEHTGFHSGFHVAPFSEVDHVPESNPAPSAAPEAVPVAVVEPAQHEQQVAIEATMQSQAVRAPVARTNAVVTPAAPTLNFTMTLMDPRHGVVQPVQQQPLQPAEAHEAQGVEHGTSVMAPSLPERPQPTPSEQTMLSRVMPTAFTRSVPPPPPQSGSQFGAEGALPGAGTPMSGETGLVPPALLATGKANGKRRHMRFEIPFRVILTAGNRSFRSVCQDISVGGMRLRHRAPEIMLGKVCKIFIGSPFGAESLELKCRIVADPTSANRICFVDCSPMVLKKLEDWILSIQNEQPDQGNAA